MARIFLYIIAVLIVLALLAAIGWQLFRDDLARIALVPTSEFTPTEPMAENAYQDPAMWYSRPGIGVGDPARWQPAYRLPANAGDIEGQLESRPAPSAPEYAVFFIHPTSYLDRQNWNAPLGEEEAERIARIYVRGMASPFNSASEIWAPRYRQATMGAFLTDSTEAEQAINAAYGDVREAYRLSLIHI